MAAPTGRPQARAHHSIPAAYLQAWEGQDGRVGAYRLLVPDHRYPVWKRRSVKSLTRYDDLYTSSFSGSDSDHYENWFGAAVETPAAGPIAKARRGEQLRAGEWEALLRYVVALDLRTPVAYLTFQERANAQIPAILEKTLRNLEPNLRRAKARRHRSAPPPSPAPLIDTSAYPMRVKTVPVPEKGKVGIQVEVTVGRELWLAHMKRSIEVGTAAATQHEWTLLSAPTHHSWFTSDNPVTRLSYRSDQPGGYHLQGGWGVPKTDIFMPLSPRFLLYAQVGHSPQFVGECPIEYFPKFQRFVAEGAHRWIISEGAPRRVEWIRPRVVDAQVFQEEQQAWAKWHDLHRAAERPI